MENILNRARELTGAYGNFGTKPELVDRETIALARSTMINQELDLFVRFVYKQSEAGRFINLRSNCQIPRGIWAPWGSSGKSNLTRTERDTLRRYLFSLGQSNRPPRPLFFYNQRHWHVNTVIYPTVDDALQWLARYQMTPAIWLEFVVSE